MPRSYLFAASAALALAMLSACGAEQPDASHASPVTADTRTAGPGDVWSPGQPDASPPTQVLVSRLGIGAALDPLHLDTKQVLIPPRYGRAGWYEEGPEPGEPGRAVIAGHLDSKTGPDAFARLREVRAGDGIEVRRADGSTLAYRVQSVGLFQQSDFPTKDVYGGSSNLSEIRLITCGGAYDHTRGRYTANVIVFARLLAGS